MTQGNPRYFVVHVHNYVTITVVIVSEYGNEISGSIKCGEFFD
jgi:hypothetical protein